MVAPLIRLDYAELGPELAPPSPRDDGSVIYEAVLAWADRPLSYSWGTETPTEEALSDPAYLDGLRGLPVTVQHPSRGRVDVGDPERVGTVLSARWDSARRCVVVELLISDPEALRRIRARELTEVSAGYRVPPESLVDGRQTRRISNHIALCERGRMPGATIRLDEVSRMTPEDMAAIKAMMAELLAPLIAQMDAEDEPEPPAQMDEEAMEAVVQERADAVVGLRLHAQSLGLTPKPEAKGLRALARDLAGQLGSTRTDSLDADLAYVEAVAAERSQRADSRAQIRDAVISTPARARAGF